MPAVWYLVVALMLTAYVLLDGFDLGVGAVHNIVAKSDDERRTTLAAIGPIWDGNEVWLIASGGVLVFAFPRAYAAGFSGFYLPLMMALWLLILRGIGIEFRSKEQFPLWRSFWDGVFAFSSALLAIIFGAALGNVIRGVPVDASGYFTGPLFSNFLPGRHPGVLDWYTVTLGLFALAILTGHGLLYLSWKTEGVVHDRSRALSPKVWAAAATLGIVSTGLTFLVRASLYQNLGSRPWSWPLAALVLASWSAVFLFLKQGAELRAFLASSCLIVALLGSAAAGMYPEILPSTLNPTYSITALNSSTTPLGLKIGIMVWIPAIILAIAYFGYLFYSFRGKVRAEHSHY